MTDEKLPEESRSRVSRRTLLKLTGAGAAIAWTTPIISSVRMPAFAQTSVPCGQNVFIDDFEAETCGLSMTSLTKWNVSGSSVDIIGNGCPVPFVNAPGKVVDLDGTPCTTTTLDLNTIMDFGPGTYQVQFVLGGSQRGDAPNTVQVTLGSLNETFTIASNDPLTTYVRSAVVSSTEKLHFIAPSNGDCIGALLDDVSVNLCG